MVFIPCLYSNKVGEIIKQFMKEFCMTWRSDKIGSIRAMTKNKTVLETSRCLLYENISFYCLEAILNFGMVVDLNLESPCRHLIQT